MNSKYKELEEVELQEINISAIYSMISIGLGFGSAVAYGLLTG